MGTDRWQDEWLQGPGQPEKVVPTVERAQLDLRQLRWLRIAAVAEATTLILLIGVAVPLKHLGEWPAGVRVLGPTHGFAFVAYLWLVLQSFGAGLVSRGEAGRLVLAAFVPMAGFLAAHFLTSRAAAPLDRRLSR
ncbi:DUF3817 domain-containing protein [Methylobacterium oryzisoli]|uniref:DUF3817 domain-containing protein n=1 Tax=Methylobacterium oryzisoli TaxID=3385502 RepID=UPI00389127AD